MFCKTDITSDEYYCENNYKMHKACRNEERRRHAEKLCAYCGASLAKTDLELGRVSHELCEFNAVFSGYPRQ